MLKIEPVIISEGFGDGSGYGQGEYLFSSGMQKTQNGITPNWNVNAVVDNSTLTDLTAPLRWITEASPGGTLATFGIDASGNIYEWNGTSWTLVYKPTVNAFNGNGLIGGQDGNLYYKGDRYLGQFNGTPDYTTGTIAVTNSSPNVVGTGTTFTSGMVGQRIVIAGVWYTIATFTDATHIALSTNYGGSTASGVSFAVKVGWTDKFQDFSSAITPSGTFCPMETYEDVVLIAHGSEIGTYNVVTNTFTATAFTLPSGFTIRTIKSGATGILIAANIGNRSIRFLWDNQSLRSISPWIWSNETVLSCDVWNKTSLYTTNWIVTTNRRILVSTGYTEEELVPFPDATVNGVYINCFPQGTAIINNYFFLATSVGITNRVRSGLHILNLRNLKWESAPTANNVAINNSMGAIFFDGSFTLHLSWQTTNPAKVYIGTVSNSSPTSAYIISAPIGQGNSIKTAQGVRLSLALNPLSTDTRPFSFNIATKISNMKRSIWGFAQQVGTAIAANKLTVNGTATGFNEAEVGDEVMILEGANAGQIAHITAIANQDNLLETWTLDTTLPNLTEPNILIQVAPFKLLSKQTFTTASELRDILFTCQKAIQGRKFLLKIVIDGITFTPPEINALLDFLYDDLGDI